MTSMEPLNVKSSLKGFTSKAQTLYETHSCIIYGLSTNIILFKSSALLIDR
jgi:hypothetical protein